MAKQQAVGVAHCPLSPAVVSFLKSIPAVENCFSVRRTREIVLKEWSSHSASSRCDHPGILREVIVWNRSLRRSRSVSAARICCSLAPHNDGSPSAQEPNLIEALSPVSPSSPTEAGQSRDRSDYHQDSLLVVVRC